MKAWLPFAIMPTLLAGCANDMDTFGRVPPLSPVGSGIGQTAGSPQVSSVAALAESSGTWVGGNADFFRDAGTGVLDPQPKPLVFRSYTRADRDLPAL